jgi:hypothetical protein
MFWRILQTSLKLRLLVRLFASTPFFKSGNGFNPLRMSISID